MRITTKIKLLLKEKRNKVYRKFASSIFSGLDLSADIQKILRTSNIKSIFDVGANIGQTNLDFRQRFPDASIYSFEPVSKTFKVLKKNVGETLNPYCYQFALGSEETKLLISLNPNSQTNSLIKINNNSQNKKIKLN